MIRILATAVLAAALAAPVAAQENTSVAEFRDWSVFTPSDPRECYVASQPSKWEARRNGQDATGNVRRGEIYLFVTIRPDQGVDKEVSFTGGYPFAGDDVIDVEIGGTKYGLSPGNGDSDQWAWPPSPDNDKELVDAMRAGVQAVITGVSARGTTTIDTFSLLGFTAALEQAEELCS